MNVVCSSFLAATSLFVITSLIGGCSSGSSTTISTAIEDSGSGDSSTSAVDGASPGADAGGGVNDPTCEAQVQTSQTISQRCCLSYGIDACGANLVCAALDGRKVATCYTQKSRQGGETCTDDKLCGTNKCTMGYCAGTRGNLCSPVAGCVDSTVCPSASNNPKDPTPRCETVGTGDFCVTCATQADCKGSPGSTCVSGTCKEAGGSVFSYVGDTSATFLTWLGTRCCASGTASINKSDPFGDKYQCK